jgi:multidrug efflux system outer membrane protein
MSALMSPSPRHLAGLGMALLCAACASLQPPPRASADLRESAPVIAPAGQRPGTWPDAEWWRSYGDTTLDALVAQAIGSGPDIVEADARIRTAEEEANVVGATLGLAIDASAAVTRQRLSDNGLIPTSFLGLHWYDQSNLGVAVRYQFDWWGKQRAAMESAIDRARATTAERQAAALTLAAAVAHAYFNWQADQARITLQEQAIELQQRLLAIAHARLDASLDDAEAVLSETRESAVLRDRLAALRGALQLDLVTLASLLGVDASALPALSARPLPRIGSSLPEDTGTNLLARRPDIQASRWRVEAALRDSDAIRASYYPDISLHALAELSSIDLGKLLALGSRTPQFGIAVDLPIFDAGLRRARHRVAAAKLDAAVAAYSGAVVNAAREAGLAAAALAQAAQQREQREQQLAVVQKAIVAAAARVSGGLTHVGPELNVRLAELDQQTRLVEVDLAALLADVQLKLALGGSLARGPEHD